MEKKIRSELYKMYAMLLLLAGLGIYAHDFVMKGIMAKAALNLSIFALFGIAAFIAIRHVWNLRNEVLALKALQVDYGQKSRRPLDPYKQPAIVFQEPELLGAGYRLIAEEMGKQADLQISNADVQHILHDIDMRINDRKSTIMYFSGLMVFLGLLGAFMGLMKTVGSVGDLIGGMDVSGAGGSDSFGKLIEGMKGPLNGMSVGFSSSLFGLMTSMVLGAFERCMNSAMKSLRNEFEHWLSHVAALDGTGEAGQAGHAPELASVNRMLELGARQLKSLRETVAGGAQITELTQQAMLEMAQAMTQLSYTVDKVSDPAPLLQPIADVVADLARNQTMMVGQFNGLIAAAERDRLAIGTALSRMNDFMEQHQGLNGPQLHYQLDRMVALQTELVEHGPSELAAYQQHVVQQHQPPVEAPRRGLFARWFGKGGDRRGTERESRKDGAKLARELRAMMAEQHQLLRQVEKRVNGSIATLEGGRREDHQRIASLSENSAEQNARIATLIERLQAAGGEGASELGAPLQGARHEMDVLQKRLDATVDMDGEPDWFGPTPREADDEARATGTGGNG